MATTSNYGWTTPDDSSLVKDGASAIRTLGSSIDTSLNTALGTKKAGMVLLNTTSFSGVASQAFPNSTFSSTYDNYRIIGFFTASTNVQLLWKLRIAGVDTSTTYTRMNIGGTSGGATAYIANANQTAGHMNYLSANPRCGLSVDLINPFLASPTFMTGTGSGMNSAFDSDTGYAINQSQLGNTSFDSINFLTNTGTISGTISVYGYNK
jgi:hypothetical protein